MQHNYSPDDSHILMVLFFVHFHCQSKKTEKSISIEISVVSPAEIGVEKSSVRKKIVVGKFIDKTMTSSTKVEAHFIGSCTTDITNITDSIFNDIANAVKSR